MQDSLHAACRCCSPASCQLVQPGARMHLAGPHVVWALSLPKLLVADGLATAELASAVVRVSCWCQPLASRASAGCVQDCLNPARAAGACVLLAL